MRTTRARLLLTILVTLLLAPPSADASFYVCRKKDGNDWLTNRRIPGLKCRLALDTGDADDADAPAGSRKAYQPPSLGGVPRAVEEPESTRERMLLYEPYIADAAARFQIPEHFIRAVIRVESNFRYRAVSPAGAEGLMQLMPGTAREMGVGDPFDPRESIMGGARLLRVLANRFDGDIVKVLSAYNAGSGAVSRTGGDIPFEGTEGYVRAVLDHYYRFRALSEG